MHHPAGHAAIEAAVRVAVGIILRAGGGKQAHGERE